MRIDTVSVIIYEVSNTTPTTPLASISVIEGSNRYAFDPPSTSTERPNMPKIRKGELEVLNQLFVFGTQYCVSDPLCKAEYNKYREQQINSVSLCSLGLLDDLILLLRKVPYDDFLYQVWNWKVGPEIDDHGKNFLIVCVYILSTFYLVQRTPPMHVMVHERSFFYESILPGLLALSEIAKFIKFKWYEAKYKATKGLYLKDGNYDGRFTLPEKYIDALAREMSKLDTLQNSLVSMFVGGKHTTVAKHIACLPGMLHRYNTLVTKYVLRSDNLPEDYLLLLLKDFLPQTRLGTKLISNALYTSLPDPISTSPIILRNHYRDYWQKFCDDQRAHHATTGKNVLLRACRPSTSVPDPILYLPINNSARSRLVRWRLGRFTAMERNECTCAGFGQIITRDHFLTFRALDADLINSLPVSPPGVNRIDFALNSLPTKKHHRPPAFWPKLLISLLWIIDTLCHPLSNIPEDPDPVIIKVPNNMEMVVVESSRYQIERNYYCGMAEEHTRYIIEDSMKILECNVASLRKEACHFENASLETFKKFSAYGVQIIKTQVTLTKTRIHDKQRWKNIEMRSAQISRTWDDRLLLLEYLD
ncbi:hypothetical protein INT47_012274 [Mucor saturninus]|uniref:Uncharacterized protein n=1 Tax=Mucor saturninus TaxID=64648 RepID=A0A8H7R9S9_9FUNG|nr:hypothetical protein INT47_012274 [Mucor saturninus]